MLRDDLHFFIDACYQPSLDMVVLIWFTSESHCTINGEKRRAWHSLGQFSISRSRAIVCLFVYRLKMARKKDLSLENCQSIVALKKEGYLM